MQFEEVSLLYKRFEVTCDGTYFRFLNIRNSCLCLTLWEKNDALCFWWDIK